MKKRDVKAQAKKEVADNKIVAKIAAETVKKSEAVPVTKATSKPETTVAKKSDSKSP
jgi:hypothetical protein